LAHLARVCDNFQRGECDLEAVLIDWSSASIGFAQRAPYIQSRFYRAPEVLLRDKYGPSVDMWSLGCLAAELFLGSPLFPGADEVEMLGLIQLKLGLMPTSIVQRMGDDSAAKRSSAWKLERSMYSPGNFELFLRERSGRDDFDFLAFINILRLMLQLNPDARITTASASLHPFITGTIDIAQQPMRAIEKRDEMMDDSRPRTSTRRRLSSGRRGQRLSSGGGE
jgi:serine/threonine protein kinase